METSRMMSEVEQMTEEESRDNVIFEELPPTISYSVKAR